MHPQTIFALALLLGVSFGALADGNGGPQGGGPGNSGPGDKHSCVEGPPDGFDPCHPGGGGGLDE